MGESHNKSLTEHRSLTKASAPQVVDTLGGRLVYFVEYLATTKVFDRWVSTCPLSYRSGNAPDK